MALNVGELNATLNMDTSDYTKGLSAAEKAAKKWGTTTENAAQTVSNKFGGSIGFVTRLLGGLSIVATGGYMLKLASDTEKTATTFKVLLGSADAATAMMKELKKFAAETPFEFPEIATAAKNLLALGISAEKIPGTLQALGDVAAGVNIPFGELADIYGKINVQGRVFAEDINQLQGRGIPIVQELSKQFGVSTERINQMVSDGKIGFPEIEKAFKGLTSQGGKFQGMMKELSSTLPGLLSTMTDNIKSILLIFAENFIQSIDLKKTIENFNKQMEQFVKSVEESGLAVAFSKLIPPEAKLIIVAIAGALVTALVPALYASATAAFAAAAGFIAANAAMIPILLTGAAIAALAYLIYANWAGVSDFFSDIWTVIVTNTKKAWSDIKIILLNAAQAIIDMWVKLYGWIPSIGDKLRDLKSSVDGLVTAEEEAGKALDSTTLAAVRQGKQFTFQWDITDKLKGVTDNFNKTLGDTTAKTDKATIATEKTTTTTKEQIKTIDNLQKNLKEIDAQYAVYGKSVDVAKEKTRLIKQAMVDLRVAGVDPASESYKNLQTQLNSINIGGLTTALTTNLGLSTTQATALTAKFSELTNWLGLSNDASAAMAQTLTNGLANASPNISNIITSFNSLQDSVKSLKSSMSSMSKGGVGGLMGALDIAGQIGSIINGIKKLGSAIKNAWSSFSGSKAKKEFFASLDAQSAANLKAAKEMMQPYKDYAKSIRDFSKNSLINIRGEAEAMTSFIEGLSLTATAEAVSTRIRKYGRKRTIWGTLWHYSFDQAGADSAKAFLERFMEISQGLSSGVSSAFSTGIKAFLGGKSDWMTTLRDGIRDAIIDAITTAVMQATIIKGALGDLLGDLSAGLTAGEDVTDIIEQIGKTIPTVAKQLEQVLTPLRGAIASAFPNTEIPAMADGGIVSRPTMALIGEAGPEAVVPLSQMGSIGGRNQTIIIELDGRTIGRAAVQHMPREVRIKTGLAFT